MVGMNVSPLIEILRSVRASRRVSQLELALSLGVSQRHVSFVESGRARPSRELLLAWLRELETPLEHRNAALLAAGYAPAYGSADLSEASLVPAIAGLRLLLSAHDPWPAFVLDAHWNLIDLNNGARRLSSLLTAGSATIPTMGPTMGPDRARLNMLDALAAPGGFSRRITNLREVGPALVARLRREARVIPGLASRTQLVEDMVNAALGPAPLHQAEDSPPAPLLTTRFDTPVGPLAFFSMFTTFGTPQDITLASLRVELLFAGDTATSMLWQTTAAE
jgi:transcriptional regulator with XRE-family HTH domain